MGRGKEGKWERRKEAGKGRNRPPLPQYPGSAPDHCEQ